MKQMLTIAGNGSAIELGAGVAGKELNAGKIGYQQFTSYAFDIVGAGTSSSNRKIKFWSEGGAVFRGQVGIHGSVQISNNTVAIGSQCWMAENLRVGKMINGTREQTDNGEIEKYCYNDNINLCTSDGGLYQWDEMMGHSTIPGVQGICPNGWHLPGDEEWKDLEMALGMTRVEADSTSWRGTDQGTQLKKGGTSGFQALLAGVRKTDGSFSFRGADAIFWSSAESGSLAWIRFLLASSGVLSVRREAILCVALWTDSYCGILILDCGI